MMRLLALALLAASALRGGQVDDLVERILSLSAKETPLPRTDTLNRAAKLLDAARPDLARHLRSLASPKLFQIGPPFELPRVLEPAEIQHLVEEVEHSGDDPAAYFALAGVIRQNRLSAGQDNPSIRARIALLDLDQFLNPVLIRLDGVRVRLNDYRKQPVLLAFWATWCVPCRAELSRLEKVTKEDATVLAISWEPLATVQAFLEKHPSSLSIFLDPGHKLSDQLRIDRIPRTVVLALNAIPEEQKQDDNDEKQTTNSSTDSRSAIVKPATASQQEQHD